MSMNIDLEDDRTARALAIAADAGQWLKVRTIDGEVAYGVPSQRKAGSYYTVTPTACDCEDFKRNGLRSERIRQAGEHTTCKHVRAVQIHEALIRGIAPMPTRRRHLTLVQPAAARALVSRLDPDTLAKAAKYDDIFDRFEED